LLDASVATQNKSAPAHHEFLPDELVKKAEAALRAAERVHTDVLLKNCTWFHDGGGAY